MGTLTRLDILFLVGNAAIGALVGALTVRWPELATAAVPPVLWLAVVLVLAAPRAEGDLVVPGTATGLGFLLAGAVAGAYGAASTIVRQRNPTIAPSR